MRESRRGQVLWGAVWPLPRRIARRYTCATDGRLAGSMLEIARGSEMVFVVSSDPVPLRTDESGTVRVGRTRVLLDLVVQAYEAGASPEEIVDSYSTLQLADVYAIIAYYLHHRGEVGAYLAERERWA